MAQDEKSVFIAGGRMFDSQKSQGKSIFNIKKLDTGDWEVNLKMTISSQEAEKSIFQYDDFPVGVDPRTVSNLIFIENVKTLKAGSNVLVTNSIEPISNQILIGGKPNTATNDSGGAIIQFIVSLNDAGKTDQGTKTDQSEV
jgi:hypothetical protein